MRQRKRLDKTWLYVIALAVIILVLMIVFREEVGLSPEKDDDKNLDNSELGVSFLELDKNIDSKEMNIIKKFGEAVGEVNG